MRIANVVLALTLVVGSSIASSSSACDPPNTGHFVFTVDHPTGGYPALENLQGAVVYITNPATNSTTSRADYTINVKPLFNSYRYDCNDGGYNIFRFKQQYGDTGCQVGSIGIDDLVGGTTDQMLIDFSAFPGSTALRVEIDYTQVSGPAMTDPLLVEVGFMNKEFGALWNVSHEFVPRSSCR